jgi:hypothetical protein
VSEKRAKVGNGWRRSSADLSVRILVKSRAHDRSLEWLSYGNALRTLWLVVLDRRHPDEPLVVTASEASMSCGDCLQTGDHCGSTGPDGTQRLHGAAPAGPVCCVLCDR